MPGAPIVAPAPWHAARARLVLRRRLPGNSDGSIERDTAETVDVRGHRTVATVSYCRFGFRPARISVGIFAFSSSIQFSTKTSFETWGSVALFTT